MNNWKTLGKVLAIALVAASAPATAEFVTVAEAYEVALSDFQAPATRNGGISFSTCEDCDRMRLRVGPSTVYVVNGNTVRFEKFREALLLVRDRSKPTVVVKHHLETNEVLSIKITIRD